MLDTRGNLSYTIGAKGNTCHIRIGDNFLDELIDDFFEPMRIEQDEHNDTLHFGKVRVIIERIED